ncbi:MAG: cell surface protein SprA, partial [Bacteroidia bacterium]|nr:cell surface protein SprA [Bacteroidia bacterium]
VIPRSGSIVFPVLEPFGSSLDSLFQDPVVAEKYKFQELYDTTVTIAREILVKNKFVMAGKYKSTVSSEYSLGAWNIPQGSVTVRAGSQLLTEGVDYEVDYGIGRVRIINEAYLQQGAPINISYEDNSVFSLQQKTMLGLRAEYEVNDNFYIGGTYLRLFERPFTEKVNIGDDPINNRIFGLDMDFSNEAPWITKAVDKLPFYSTNTESNINFTAEVAALKPGHSGAVNLNGSDDNSGVVSIDDFEGAVSGFPLSSQPNRWVLASVPETEDFPESQLNNDLTYGANRARLNWYVIDRAARRSNVDSDNSYTRFINQQELFNRQLPQGQLPDLFTFDMTYYPDERGPYNFDPPGGTVYSAGIQEYDRDQEKLVLAEPESRWAGIMRYMQNSDFQAANYEFIEFWLLNPFMEKPDGSGHIPDENGFITFHLGNVSEDLMHDNIQFYENSIPTPDETVPIKPTRWGNVPLDIPTNNAFDNANRTSQDLGFDGLTDEQERVKFQEYIDEVEASFSLPQSVFNDPSADNFCYFNDFDNCFTEDDNLLTRYKNFNNPQGNSPDLSQQSTFQRGNPNPDKEDLNNNQSLDQGESFYEYKVPIVNSNGEIDTSQNQFIREVRAITNTQNSQEEKWYRFRIPLSEGASVNGIEGFRSIQFMRILVNGFSTQKTFRMAEFELVRNQWRRLPGVCNVDGVFDGDFSIDAVGIEENQSKQPFNYVLPKGIKQERLFSTFANVLQDEKSISLNFCELQKDCEISIYKLTELDLRVFEKMQMFVHAEEKDNEMEDGDVSIFMRIGKDFDRHYYEYEIPLKLSNEDSLANISSLELPDLVWPEENMFNFILDLLIQTKKIRNVLNVSKDDRFIIDNEWLLENLPDLDQEYRSIFIDTIGVNQYLPEGHRVTVRGNPNLGIIKGIQIGLRNISERPDAPVTGFCGEVWVNELRVTGLQERGGVAGLARLDIQMADLGNLSAAGSYSSLGWGALDQKVNDRAKEEVIEYDFATNLELGKFFPEHWGLRVPFYAQYAKSIRNPEFDAYDFDITVEDEFDLVKNKSPEFADTISARNQTIRTIKTFNFTNVRKEKTTGKKKKPDNSSQNKSLPQDPKTQQQSRPQKPSTPKPWDISNISLSYAFTEINFRDPILKADNSKDYKLGLDYNYSRRGGYIEPFKKLIKTKSLSLIKEINLNPLPNSFAFSSNINRFIATRRFRVPEDPTFEFEDRRFDWERRYDINWNLTKSIKVNFSAFNESYIDELRQIGVAETPEQRPWVDEFGNEVDISSDPGQVKRYWQDNLRDFGRNTNYNHNLSVNYSLPFKYIPFMEWIDVKAQYRSSYNWAAGPLITIDDQGNSLGSIIQNGQNRSITANFNLDKLYGKSKYLKSLEKTKRSSSRSRSRTQDQTKIGRDQNTSDNPENRRGRNKEREA